MRLLLITHHLGSAGGGVTAVVDEYARRFASRADVLLAGHKGNPFKDSAPQDVQCHPRIPLASAALGLGRPLIDDLIDFKPDVVHVHGIFTLYTTVGRFVSERCRSRFFISPHGMLESWALQNSRFKKVIFSTFFENKNLRSASVLHALNQAEVNDINRVYPSSQTICIPNGVALPDLSLCSTGSLQCDSRKTLLFLGRLHPKKGLLELVRAFSIARQASKAFADRWQLTIAGWGDDAYRLQLELAVTELGLGRNVVFSGPVFGEAKQQMFLQADAFVLPSFSEGQPMAVLEAWAYELPVLMTPECNLPEGFYADAAIRVDTKPEELAKSLVSLSEYHHDELRAIGVRGRQLVERYFSWDSVVSRMMDAYQVGL
jgi:poly(glycerol-phosphate) alpha-glucosyltransferase